jgi:putative ABC transport system permease protein
VRISGIARFGTVDSPGGATVVLFRRTVAQRLIAEPGKFDTISIAAAAGVTQQQLAARVTKILPPGVEAVTGAAMTKETQSAARKAMGFFRTFMLAFAIVALLVGAFLIFNTFSITVAQRTRENGLRRALGASRRQILASVLLEAFAIGVIASLLGLVGGLGVAIGLKALLAAVGIPVPAGSVVFKASTVVISLVVGVGVAVLAALSPARKAAKVPPIAAMQHGLVGSTGYGSQQRVYVGSGLLLVGLATLFTGLFGSVAQGVMLVGAGALLVFFGVSVLGRTISLPLSRLIGARHRQHARAVHLRTHPGDRPAQGRGHDALATASSIRWESVIIAVQGTVLGRAIGLFFGWALVSALDEQGLTVFRIPYGSLAIIVVLAASAGMVAAIGPSRRAAKLNVLKAETSD